MKRYPAYKDSGIAWPKTIPSHWQSIKLGRIGYFSASGIDKKSDPNELPVRMVNYTDVYGNISLEVDSSDLLMETTTTAEKIMDHSLKKGDILFTPSSETEDDIGVSVVISRDLPGTVYSYHLIRFRVNRRVDLSHGFRKYFCNNHEVLAQFSRACKGTTRQILGRDDFKDTLILLPPHDEQKGIADYLNRKTAQIDDLISKKEKMIELLKEERIAIINQAVIKGLDPKVEMKDSGIEWLGKVPKHWEIKKLKYIANVETGITPPSNETAYYDNGDIDWFTPGDFNDSIFLNDSNRKLTHKAVQEGVAKVYKPFAVLMIGIGATLGKIGIIDKSASSNQQINAISFSSNFNPFYGAFYFKAIAISIISLSNASTLAILNQSQTKDIMLTVPPLDEQNGIAEFIKLVNIQTDNLILKGQTQIDLLKEYRTALISEVVTGKTDVRKN